MHAKIDWLNCIMILSSVDVSITTYDLQAVLLLLIQPVNNLLFKLRLATENKNHMFKIIAGEPYRCDLILRKHKAAVTR